MAKQVGPHYLEGTIGDVTYYALDGQHLARKKSSLTGKRVKKDPSFANTRRYAGYRQQVAGWRHPSMAAAKRQAGK
jgi:hypothetical protein